MYLTTDQVGALTSMRTDTIADFVRRGVIDPARRGKRSQSHLFTGPQTLALGVGQVLLHYGIRGQALHNAIKMIAGHSKGDLQRVFESRPVLALIPGAAVVAELVSRDFVQEQAEEFLQTVGATPIGIDLERMHRKMLECIARHEVNGWKTEPADNAQQQRIAGAVAAAERN